LPSIDEMGPFVDSALGVVVVAWLGQHEHDFAGLLVAGVVKSPSATSLGPTDSGLINPGLIRSRIRVSLILAWLFPLSRPYRKSRDFPRTGSFIARSARAMRPNQGRCRDPTRHPAPLCEQPRGQRRGGWRRPRSWSWYRKLHRYESAGLERQYTNGSIGQRLAVTY